jgi:catechol 2,3-dioxygenase-like lactoylglutathione lyase family enzyme
VTEATPPRLAYVALALREPERLAEALSGRLGLSRHGVVLDGEQTIAVSAGGASLFLLPLGHAALSAKAEPGVHHLGFETAAPEDWLRHAGLTAGGEGAPAALDGISQHRIDPQATLGVEMRVSRPLGLSAGNSALVERIDHIGVASSDNRRAVDLFVVAMGFPIESQQTDLEVVTVIESFTSDKYGVVYRSRPPAPVGGLRVAFVTAGECELEFLQNFDPGHGADVRHGGPGTTKQDQGAIARYVAKRGPGLHHLALKTPDIDRALATLDGAGFRVIDRIGRPGSRRARIGFVHPSALGGVLLHFVEREPV